mmetsp:Transcript_3303/g.14404  ORF Transcript_3303/g.14404 Transcript_3303/m.14404 type:complete len:227 (+) Transcript_3303:1316-1996(+)
MSTSAPCAADVTAWTSRLVSIRLAPASCQPRSATPLDSRPAISRAVAKDAVALVDGSNDDPAPLNVSTTRDGSAIDAASFAFESLGGAASVRMPAAAAALSNAPTAAFTVPLTMSLTSSLTCFSMESADFLGVLDGGPALRPPRVLDEESAWTFSSVASSSSSSSSKVVAERKASTLGAALTSPSDRLKYCEYFHTVADHRLVSPAIIPTPTLARGSVTLLPRGTL